MKKALFFLFLAVILLGSSPLSAGTTTELILKIEGGDLIIAETTVITTEKERYPNVPEGLDANTAYKLAKGYLSKYELSRNETTQVIFSPFSVIKEEVVTKLTNIEYRNNSWEKEETNYSKTKDDWWLSILLWVSAICIFAISAVNRKEKIRKERLFLFYVVLIGSIILSYLLSFHFVLFCLFLIFGMLSGAFACIKLENRSLDTTPFFHPFLGELGGSYTILIVMNVALQITPGNISLYALSYIIICAISFLTAHLIFKNRKIKETA